MEVMLATRNGHKLEEFARLLAPHTVVPLPVEVELPPEDGDTFTANAFIKARAAVAATGKPVIADDSGICSVFLNGDPGIRSARFAGEDATDEANLAKLLRSVPADADRRAYYVCALVYVAPGEPEQEFVLRCDGQLIAHPRGTGGFGYDPAFVPDATDDDRTMAELTADEKDAISHRGLAARAFLAWLNGRDQR